MDRNHNNHNNHGNHPWRQPPQNDRHWDHRERRQHPPPFPDQQQQQHTNNSYASLGRSAMVMEGASGSAAAGPAAASIHRNNSSNNNNNTAPLGAGMRRASDFHQKDQDTARKLRQQKQQQRQQRRNNINRHDGEDHPGNNNFDGNAAPAQISNSNSNQRPSHHTTITITNNNINSNERYDGSYNYNNGGRTMDGSYTQHQGQYQNNSSVSRNNNNNNNTVPPGRNHNNNFNNSNHRPGMQPRSSPQRPLRASDTPASAQQPSSHAQSRDPRLMQRQPQPQQQQQQQQQPPTGETNNHHDNNNNNVGNSKAANADEPIIELLDSDSDNDSDGEAPAKRSSQAVQPKSPGSDSSSRSTKESHAKKKKDSSKELVIELSSDDDDSSEEDEPVKPAATPRAPPKSVTAAHKNNETTPGVVTERETNGSDDSDKIKSTQKARAKHPTSDSDSDDDDSDDEHIRASLARSHQKKHAAQKSTSLRVGKIAQQSPRQLYSSESSDSDSSAEEGVPPPNRRRDNNNSNNTNMHAGGQLQQQQHQQQHDNKENLEDDDASSAQKQQEQRKQIARKSAVNPTSASSDHTNNNSHEATSLPSSNSNSAAQQQSSLPPGGSRPPQPSQQPGVINALGNSSAVQALHRQAFLASEQQKQREKEEQEQERALMIKRKRVDDDDDDDSDTSNEYSSDSSGDRAGLVTAKKSAAKSSPFMSRRCRTKPVTYQEEQQGVLDEHLYLPDTVPQHGDGKPLGEAGVDKDGNTLHDMIIVDFLTKEKINPETGLPMMTITCHSEASAEILYDFVVVVDQSGIPNSGNGAFLTFLGARHLKPGAYKKEVEVQKKKELHCHGELEAAHCHGFDINVKFSGQVVNNGNYGRPRGIGPEFVYDESDYESSPSTVFSSIGDGNGIVPLGRYGPFRKADRKSKDGAFDIKSFIFSHDPSEWAFAVQEKLFGREEQTIDITDDLTGKTHDIAKSHVPMYVNEVGHNKTLVQNVDALERHDRSIHYYINIREPMEKGDTVELLTDYLDTYEDIRERKGYGLRNLTEGLKGDDDPHARYERNVDVREIVTYDVEGLNLLRLYNMLEWVEEAIRRPLVTLTDRFLNTPKVFIGTGHVPVPSKLQWLALVRMHWLSRLFTDHLENMEKTGNGIPRIEGYPTRGMLQECKRWVTRLEWTSVSDFRRVIDRSIKDAEGNCIRDAVDFEICEHTWYDLRDHLPAPLNKGIWCFVACGLVETLSRDVSLLTWSQEPAYHLLREKIYAAASSAAKKVREAANIINAGGRDSSGLLEFESGVVKDARVTAEQLASLRKYFMEGNSLNPKGLLAALYDMHAYVDCCYLLEDHRCEPTFSLPAAREERYLMTKYEGFASGSHLASIPKSIKDTRKQLLRVNETWYIMWQVVFVAHAFAEKYLPDGDHMPIHERFSLDKLCDRTGVDATLAQICINKGVRKRTLEEKVPVHQKRKTGGFGKTVNKSMKSATGMSNVFGVTRPSAIAIWEGEPDEPLPGGWPVGWKKRVFERQSGASKGHRDRYWHSPEKDYKFRSMTEVKRFMGCLAATGGNEEQAWQLFKGRQK